MDLPDIRAKVKVATSGVAAAEGEIKAFSTSVKRSLDTNSGAGQAFVKFGKDGELASVRISSATAKTRGDLDKLEGRVRSWAASAGKDFQAGTTAVVKLGEEGTASLTRLSSASQIAAVNVEKASGEFLGMGPAGLVAAAAIADVAAAAAVASAPIVALGVSLGAVLALGGGILGGFGVLGVGAVLLAQRLQTATQASQDATAAQQALTTATHDHQVAVKQLETLQASLKGHRANADQLQLLADLQQRVKTTSYDLVAAQNAVKAAGEASISPFQRLSDHVGKLADGLGKQATPAANLIYTWLGKVADRIEPVASKLLDWFGTRLPRVLPIVDKLMADVGAALAGFGARLGPIVDDWIKHPEHFEEAFKQVVDKVVSLTGEIVQKAQELATWWAAHHVQLEKDAGRVFNIIGSFAQAAIYVVEALIGVFEQFVVVFDTVSKGVDRGARIVGQAIDAIGASARAAELRVLGLLQALSSVPGAGRLIGGAADALQSSLVSGSVSAGLRAGGTRDIGGPVIPGRVYDIGAGVREKLVMYPGGGGYVVPTGEVSVSNMASTRRMERLLEAQNKMLSTLIASPTPVFSKRAYGT